MNSKTEAKVLKHLNRSNKLTQEAREELIKLRAAYKNDPEICVECRYPIEEWYWRSIARFAVVKLCSKCDRLTS